VLSILVRFTASVFCLVSSNCWPLRCLSSNKDRQHNGQKFEYTKEKTEAVNLTRIDNTMAKSLKIPKRKCLLFIFLVSSNFWPLCCLSFSDLWLLFSSLVSSNFWPLCCLSFFDWWLLFSSLVSSNFWPLCCQHNGQKFEDTKELNRSRKSNKDRQHNGQKSFCLALWYLQTFGHCVVYPCLIYGFCLALWYLQTFGHCVVYPCLIYDFCVIATEIRMLSIRI
jgi:hypothetical protein